MRKNGLWHPRLAEVVAGMGHTDTLVVADAGLPVPRGVEKIDLVWWRGRPPLIAVLRGIVSELVVELATIADEAKDQSLLASLEDALSDIAMTRISHETLKDNCGSATAVVRTGEDTPYANVILHAGVPF